MPIMKPKEKCLHPKDKRELVTTGKRDVINGQISDDFKVVEVCTACGALIRENPEEETIIF